MQFDDSFEALKQEWSLLETDTGWGTSPRKEAMRLLPQKPYPKFFVHNDDNDGNEENEEEFFDDLNPYMPPDFEEEPREQPTAIVGISPYMKPRRGAPERDLRPLQRCSWPGSQLVVYVLRPDIQLREQYDVID